MTQPAFTQRHFDLLSKYGGTLWTQTETEQQARQALEMAYQATERWAKLLQARRFPEGYASGAKHVIVRGHHFSPYTWWRVYPAKDSPPELAYTVGIDKSGHFIVKIDTCGDAKAIRARYEMECGPRYETSPFWEMIPAHEGLSMSENQLVEWSMAAIDRFQPNYDDLYKRVTDAPRLQRVQDPLEESAYIRQWIRCLIENSNWSAKGMFRTSALVFSSSDSMAPLVSQFKLTVDGPWLVQINQTKATSPSPSFSLIAKDKNGRAYLMRRGLLQSNGVTNAVRERQFASRSGLLPVSISGTDGGQAWYVVAALDEGADTLIEMTAEFVRACDFARGEKWTDGEKPPAPTYFVSSQESGGTYLVSAKAAREERMVRKLHGDVWQALSRSLEVAGVKLLKCRHPLGYEIDGAFTTSDGRDFLIEIKTNSNASSIHEAIGQLHLYPSLMPVLRKSKRFLLLPSMPDKSLIEAITNLGISLHTFSAEADNVVLSSDLLTACLGG